jgi:hypothetical protein
LSTSTSKSQIPIIDQAIEAAVLMFGTDKSRGWLEMICGALQAGADPLTRCERIFAARPRAAPTASKSGALRDGRRYQL